MRVHVRPALGHQSIHSIKRPQVRTIVDNLIEQGKEGAAQGLLTAVRNLFNYAVEQDMIEYSPADHIRPKFVGDGRRRVEFSPTLLQEAWDLEMPVQSRNLGGG